MTCATRAKLRARLRGLVLSTIPWIAVGVALAAPLGAQEDGSGPAAVDLPARIPLELDADESDRLGLSRFGVCCFVNEFFEEPPDAAANVPPPVGSNRVFQEIELADSRIVLSFEDLEQDRSTGARVLVRADLDQDGDLGDDPVHHCLRWHLCGPFETEARHGGRSAPYAFTIRYFALGGDGIDVLWYWRAVALTGSFAGREIAVIDEDSNGRYDDPEDVVVFDVDGDGALEGGHEGRERRARHQPIPWAGEWLRVTDVDPVALSLRIERAPTETRKHKVVDFRSGEPLEGVRVTSYPGGFSAVTDRRGEVAVEWPEGPVHFVTAVADGYWSAVFGTDESAVRKRILLEPTATCRGPGIHWCGRATLPFFAMPKKKRHRTTNKNRIDLDSGFLGPRVGGPPGPEDLGWFVHSGEAYLEAFGEARFDHLGTSEGMSFQGISPAGLRRFTLDRRRIDGGPECRSDATLDPGARILPGALLGVRTQEGRLGKIRVERCRGKLELTWVIYSEGSDAAAEEDRAETGASLRLVSKTPVGRPRARTEDTEAPPAGSGNESLASVQAALDAVAAGERGKAAKVLDEARRHGSGKLTGVIQDLLKAYTKRRPITWLANAEERALGTPHAEYRATLPLVRTALARATAPEARRDLRYLLCHLRTFDGEDDEPREVVARRGGSLREPRQIFGIHPEHTPQSRRARVNGVVIIQLVIDREGCVNDIRVLKGEGYGLDEATRSAAKWWVYEPATLRGEPVSVYYYVTTAFRIRRP